MSTPEPLAAQLSPYPNLDRLVAALLETWPEHAAFLSKRFAQQETAHLRHADELAELVLRLCAAGLAECCADYRWMCARLLEEELYFSRHGRYRAASAEAVAQAVYGDPQFMARYMNGLLLSQVLWSNHTAVSALYTEAFLRGHPAPYRHLEVGPGHGLLLYFAARDPRCLDVVGWDVSATSLAATADALATLGISRAVRLEPRSVLDAASCAERFDSVVISEVLEHLEQPLPALRELGRILSPGGRMFVNMPVNSPAPDHIYLVREPAEVVDLVRAAGLTVAEHHVFPASGYSEAQARRQRRTMSIVVIARNG